jgi:hypothetical protein
MIGHRTKQKDCEFAYYEPETPVDSGVFWYYFHMEKINNELNQRPPVRMEVRPGEFNSLIRGTEIDGLDLDKFPTELVRVDRIVRFEPIEKMEIPGNDTYVEELVQKIKNGQEHEIDPILVMEVRGGYMVVDGHHRYHAHVLAESRFIAVKVIPEE